MTQAASGFPVLPLPLDGDYLELMAGAGRIAVYYARPESPSQQAPLLLVHSVNASASAAEVAPLFDHYRNTRPVYALDLPGYGLSDRSDRAYTPRLMTDALHAVVELIRGQCGGGPVDVLGVSLACEFVVRLHSEDLTQCAALRWSARLALAEASGITAHRGLRVAYPGCTERWLIQCGAARYLTR